MLGDKILILGPTKSLQMTEYLPVHSLQLITEIVRLSTGSRSDALTTSNLYSDHSYLFLWGLKIPVDNRSADIMIGHSHLNTVHLGTDFTVMAEESNKSKILQFILQNKFL